MLVKLSGTYQAPSIPVVLGDAEQLYILQKHCLEF